MELLSSADILVDMLRTDRSEDEEGSQKDRLKPKAGEISGLVLFDNRII